MGMNVCLYASSTLGEYMARFREAPAKSACVCVCVRAQVCVEGWETNAKEISAVSKAPFGVNIMGEGQ